MQAANTSTSTTPASLRGAFAHLVGVAALTASLLAPSLFAPGSSAAAQTPAHMSQVLPATGAPTASQYFSATGKTVSGVFLGAFNRFGLQSIGWPLSDARQENGLTVQYFERVRMEYHPETASAGFPVLMTRLGADISKPAQPFAAVAPFASTSSRVYMPQTRHSLSEPFLSYWKGNGGLELFGYPISEQMTQDGMRVQWFERARFEYHPELAKSGHAVELTLLGRMAYEQASPQVQAQTVSTTKVSQAPATSPSSLSSMESYLLTAINQQRAAAGLGAVAVNAALTDVARSRSSDMAARNYFSHTTPEGRQFFSMLSEHGIDYKYAGEILARNNYPDSQAAQVAMSSYLGSAPHKAIIMDGRYGIVGIGYSKAADGMHYFTVLFVQQ